MLIEDGLEGCELMCCGLDVLLDGTRILIPSFSSIPLQQHAVIHVHSINRQS